MFGPRVSKNQEVLLIVFAACLIPVVMIYFWIRSEMNSDSAAPSPAIKAAPSPAIKEDTSRSNVPSPSPNDPSPSPQQIPTEGPPLALSTSGRLLKGLHGLELNMTMKDAILMMPHFDEKTSGLLYERNSDGFEVHVFFNQGRVFLVYSSIESITTEDADSFYKDTIAKLGEPDVALVHWGKEEKEWIWIDGDLRVRFTDTASGDLGHHFHFRRVTLEIVNFPIYIADLQRHHHSSTDINGVLVHWGAVAAVYKQLPTSFDSGVRLGMTPFEVRSLVKGIEISMLDDRVGIGVIRNNDKTSFAMFLDNHLYSICIYSGERRSDLSALREELVSQYGTPTNSGFLELLPTGLGLTWQDDRIRLEVQDVASANIPEWCLVDEELKDISDLYHNRNRNSQITPKSPEIKSFF